MNNLNEQEITLIVQKLYDNDFENIPDNFKDIPPILFSEIVLKLKKINGYNSIINIPANNFISEVLKIINKIEEVRLITEQKNFDLFWKCFSFNLDVSVWGSDPWCPRILPNGAILIRNHHRVISIGNQIEGSINISSKTALSDLLKISNCLESDDDFSFSVVTQQEDGIIWTKTIPENLNFFGQTVVLIEKYFLSELKNNSIINLDNFILNPLIESIAANSRTGHCVLRLFNDKIFLYSTYRADDDYDSILENYSYYIGSSPDQEPGDCLEISNNQNKIHTLVSEMIQNELEYCELLNELKDFPDISTLITQKLIKGYAGKKSNQISQFEPIFGKDYLKPVSYFKDCSEFLDLSKQFNYKLFSIKSDLSFLSKVKNGTTLFKNKMKKIASKFTDVDIKFYFHSEGISFNENDVVDYNSDEYLKKLNIFFDKFQQDYLENFASDNTLTEIDFAQNCGYDYNFYIFIITKESLDPSLINNYGLSISKILDSSISLDLPNYGYYQGYCSGELDTGNINQFLLEEDFN